MLDQVLEGIAGSFNMKHSYHDGSIGQGSLLAMTKDFDVISETPIEVEETGEGTTYIS